MDGGAWWAAVHEVAKSWTRLSDFTFTFHFHGRYMEKQWKLQQTIFLSFKITADDDYSHEIKKCLLLGRKAMTNLQLLLSRFSHV